MKHFGNANRTEVRNTVVHLNTVLGRKAFVQPRTKNSSGFWQPAHKGGVLSLKCPPRVKPIPQHLKNENGSSITVHTKPSMRSKMVLH